ncbi:MAG TPA: minichromosome maintenance protein MCM [Candidatus Thermoplasmatota archaeon]|jgi:replicative DNA helicase Mcm|nr:minichromosome maintenance protein MCM [Candidatus Thermoplasmatota archaeon]
MPETIVQPSEDVLLRSWEEFLRKYYKARLNEVALEYPQQRSLAVDYWDLDRHSPQLAEFLLERPTAVLLAAEKAVQAVDLPLQEPPRLHVRIQHLPEHAVIKIRELRAIHLGRLIAVEGLVKRASSVGPRVEDAKFRCLRCDAVIQEPQDEHLVLKDPLQCYEDQGGCGHSSGFKLLTEKSRFVDSQHLEVQESPEALRGGEQPQRLALFAEDDLCGAVAPGDRIVAVGVLRATPKKQGNAKSTLFQLHLQVVSIELRQQAYEEVKITPEEEVDIVKLAKDPGVFSQLTSSMAPTIFGMETEKEALVLQLFGGVEKRMPDKTRIRGDIHVLMVGDPGVAKSQLLRYAARIHPRGIYTSGKSSSAAGLTAAAVRDEVEGRWTLEAGAMVLADRGLACIDEMDKMTEEDRSAMHEALEQGTVSIAKAGITASLNSRCSVLGAANPKDGRFDTKYGSIAEQIDMPPALLSRFDVIFPMTDKPHAERDGALASHILGVHRAGEIREYRGVHGDQGLFTAADEEAAMVRVQPPVTPEMLRKYVAYARNTCFPVITPEAQARIRDYYVDLRKQAGGEEGGPVPMTPRQLEAMVRLAEASARVRLHHEAAVEDVERAIRIVEYYLRRVAGAEGGLFDIDKIASGVSHTQRDRLHRLILLVEDLARGQEHGAHIDDILAKARAQGMGEQEVREALDRLVQTSRLFEPRGQGHGYYKRV